MYKIIQITLKKVHADRNFYREIFKSYFKKSIHSRKNNNVSSLLSYISKNPKQYLLEQSSNGKVITFSLDLAQKLTLYRNKNDKHKESEEEKRAYNLENALEERIKLKKLKTETADLHTLLKFNEKYEIRYKRRDCLENALKPLQPTRVNPKRYFCLSGSKQSREIRCL